MKLKAEATRFREVTGVSSLHEAKLAYRGMNDMERAFFPQVFEFMKILLACPVSSSTAERSFKAVIIFINDLFISWNSDRIENYVPCLIVFCFNFKIFNYYT